MIVDNIKTLRVKAVEVRGRAQAMIDHLDKAEIAIELGTLNANALDTLQGIKTDLVARGGDVVAVMGSPDKLGKNMEEVTTIPSIVGDNIVDARAAMAMARLTEIQETPVYHETVPVGEVLSQRPDAGKEVETDTQIYIGVSDGPEPEEL